MKQKLLMCVVISALCALFLFAGCNNQAGSSSDSTPSAASSSAPSAESSTAPSSTPSTASSTAPSAASSSDSSQKSESSSGDVEILDNQGGVEVYLDYYAGTGYEWECSIDPEGVLGIARQETMDTSKDKNITGGSLRDVVTLIANSPGTAALTCELKRPWETGVEPAEVQTFVFTVDSDLQIDFDEKASDFAVPPAQISFS